MYSASNEFTLLKENCMSRARNMIFSISVITLISLLVPLTSTVADPKKGSGASSEIEASSARGGMRYRVMVSKFEDLSNYNFPAGYIVTNAWEEYMTNALNNDGRFLVIAGKDDRVEARQEEVFAEKSGWAQNPDNGPKTGRMAAAQLLVRGTVTHVEAHSGGAKASTSLGGLFSKIKGDQAAITLIVKLYDATTGIVVASREVTGKSTAAAIDMFGLPEGTNVGLSQSKDLAKATSHALKQAVDFCAEQLGKIPWMGAVADAEDQTDVIVDRGAREGVVIGQEFVVGTARPIVSDETGELLTYRKKPIGRLKVTELEEKAAYCEPVGVMKSAIADSMKIWLPDSTVAAEEK